MQRKKRLWEWIKKCVWERKQSTKLIHFCGKVLDRSGNPRFSGWVISQGSRGTDVESHYRCQPTGSDREGRQSPIVPPTYRQEKLNRYEVWPALLTHPPLLHSMTLCRKILSLTSPFSAPMNGEWGAVCVCVEGGYYTIIQITAGDNIVADVPWSTMLTDHSRERKATLTNG